MIPWDEFWPAMLQVGIGAVLISLLVIPVLIVTIYVLDRYL